MMQNNHYKVSRHARVNFNLKVIYFLPQNKKSFLIHLRIANIEVYNIYDAAFQKCIYRENRVMSFNKILPIAFYWIVG